MFLHLWEMAYKFAAAVCAGGANTATLRALLVGMTTLDIEGSCNRPSLLGKGGGRGRPERPVRVDI